jgi:small subunit ribosomal protein S10
MSVTDFKNSTNVKKIRLKLRAYDHKTLEQACSIILKPILHENSGNLSPTHGSKIVGPVTLPTRRRRYCVLTSPHVNKKAREQFEIRTHKRLIDINYPTNEEIYNITHLDMPAGVGIQVLVETIKK